MIIIDLDELENELKEYQHMYNVLDLDCYIDAHSLTGGMINNDEHYTQAVSPFGIVAELEEQRKLLEYKIKRTETQIQLYEQMQPQTEEEIELLRCKLHQKMKQVRDYKANKLQLAELHRQHKINEYRMTDTIRMHGTNLLELEQQLAHKQVERLQRLKIPTGYIIFAEVLKKAKEN